MTSGADALWDDIGFLAFHLNWPLNDLLDLPHGIRQRLVVQSRSLANPGTFYG